MSPIQRFLTLCHFSIFEVFFVNYFIWNGKLGGCFGICIQLKEEDFDESDHEDMEDIFYESR